ncbi:hypothetical protein D3C78_1488060 [compost metagenome]
MSCIAALSALKHVQDTDAPHHCSMNGQALAAALSDLSARAVGGLVAIPLPLVSNPVQLQQSLYQAGVFINSPSNCELLLRPPICARRDVLLRSAEIIKEVISNAAPHAA